MCIFALARTTEEWKNVKGYEVVNCFKMCIFALARTTTRFTQPGSDVL